MQRSDKAKYSIARGLSVPAGLGLLGLFVALGGCGTGTQSSASQPVAAESLAGVVMGGRQPIAGATVKLWAASPTPGGPATLLDTTTTNSNGNFSATFDPVPAEGQIVYVVAAGGDAGSGANTAIKLATVAGPYCTGSGCDFPSFVNVNELATVAMAYSLDGYISLSGGSVNVSGPTAGPGLDNAVATFASLVKASNGTSVFQDAAACTGSGEPANCNALRKLDTLADIAAACVNSSGPGTTACGSLFNETGSASNTFAALFNIATEASVRNDNTGIYGLLPSGSAIYAPTLDVAPHDWTLALVYTGGGLFQPVNIAIDAEGNVWVADTGNDLPQGTDRISEFAPDGTPISPGSGGIGIPGGFRGGGLNGPWGIAVDDNGNVWVANWNGGDGTTVSEFAADGTHISPSKGRCAAGSPPGGYCISGISPGPYAFAMAADGTIWLANYGNSSLSHLDASGTELAQYRGGGMQLPVSVAVDALGDVWTANQSNSTVSEFAPASATWLSPASGYTGGGLNEPDSLALDADGNAWIANFYGPDYPAGPSAVTELVGGNTPPASCPGSPGPGDTGCPLSPASGFLGGGLKAAAIAAVDSAGHIFISNFHGNSVTELNVADGSALSPSAGYQNPAIISPEGISIDASGNLWLANYAANELVKFIGLAAPVKTPLRGLPTAP